MERRCERLLERHHPAWAAPSAGRGARVPRAEIERVLAHGPASARGAQRLKAHRAEQAQRPLALGSGWDSSYGDLVCERGDGSPLRPDARSKAFKRLASKAGLDPSTSLHSLRHAFCTELGRRHVHPKIVSALAGHSSTAFTLTTYTAAWEEGVDEAAAALAQALDLGAK